jgi:hypothetical protein
LKRRRWWGLSPPPTWHRCCCCLNEEAALKTSDVTDTDSGSCDGSCSDVYLAASSNRCEFSKPLVPSSLTLRHATLSVKGL